MPHIACRDKNVIGMGAQILGAYMNGIRNFLLVTGDPVPSGERDVVTSVYDFHSVSLMKYLERMNREHFAQDPVAYGGPSITAGPIWTRRYGGWRENAGQELPSS